jgi:hypothetical protein
MRIKGIKSEFYDNLPYWQKRDIIIGGAYVIEFVALTLMSLAGWLPSL